MASNVEEEVGRARVVTILEEFGQGKPEDALIELDRPLDVARDEDDVMHSAAI